MVIFGKKFLEENQSRSKESCLGDHQTFDGGEGNDTQEERDQRLDLQLEESIDRYQLLQLLLLATAWKKTFISGDASVSEPVLKMSSLDDGGNKMVEVDTIA